MELVETSKLESQNENDTPTEPDLVLWIMRLEYVCAFWMAIITSCWFVGLCLFFFDVCLTSYFLFSTYFGAIEATLSVTVAFQSSRPRRYQMKDYIIYCIIFSGIGVYGIFWHLVFSVMNIEFPIFIQIFICCWFTLAVKYPKISKTGVRSRMFLFSVHVFFCFVTLIN